MIGSDNKCSNTEILTPNIQTHIKNINNLKCVINVFITLIFSIVQ